MPRTDPCYRCGQPATTREHFPPKSFFPRRANLPLRTVPACALHNNAKSDDDQYLLAHIAIHASRGDNLAKQIFMRSIAPQLERRPAFRSAIAAGARTMGDGSAAYRVDTARFDNFFDHLCHAIFFTRYGVAFNDARHSLTHRYLSLTTSDPTALEQDVMVSELFGTFFQEFAHLVESYDAAHVDEIVYQNRIVDPVGRNASITIAHTFYGIFEVVSLLTGRPPAAHAEV